MLTPVPKTLRNRAFFDSRREQPFQQTMVIALVKHPYRKEGKMQS